MKKTTVYLPDELKSSLERLAHESRRSEAELIREAISEKVEKRTRPRPKVPLRAEGLGDPTLAQRVDEALEGFGHR
jgi:hypothetical protein